MLIDCSSMNIYFVDQLNNNEILIIWYNITLYTTMSYHMILCNIISYHTMFYNIIIIIIIIYDTLLLLYMIQFCFIFHMKQNRIIFNYKVLYNMLHYHNMWVDIIPYHISTINVNPLLFACKNFCEVCEGLVQAAITRREPVFVL